MNEKYAEYKKSKQYKRQVLMNVFLFFLFGVIVFVFYQFYIKYNKEQTPNNNKNYFYEIVSNEVLLSSSDGLIGSYKCQSECDIYKGDRSYGYFHQGKILLQDGELIYLYDLLNNKKLSGNYTAVDFIFDGKGEELTNVKLFLVMNDASKYGIMNLNGALQVNLNYDALGTYGVNGTNFNTLENYSYSRNYITAKAGEKWGLIDLDNGKGLIDCQYEYIKLSEYHKLIVRERNTVTDESYWYLVDENNIKSINTGYDAIYVYERYLVLAKDAQVFISDLTGNIVSNKIALDGSPWTNDGSPDGLDSKLEDNQINLYINNGGHVEQYIYDEEAQMLIKK